jgi:hypothetical protein
MFHDAVTTYSFRMAKIDKKNKTRNKNNICHRFPQSLQRISGPEP